MILHRLWRSRVSGWHHVLAGLVVALCMAGDLTATAIPERQDCLVHRPLPPAAVMDEFFNDIVGNRTRMIQVSCVIGAIGVFFLTRKYR